jgi:hypothetical protein
MAISLPSKKFAVVDTPEVKNFEADFNYIFFTTDERLNDSGDIPGDLAIERLNPEQFSSDQIDSINFRRFTPRFTRFSWTPVVKYTSNVQSVDASIRNNLDKIQGEDQFSNDEFSTVKVQDSFYDERAKFYVKRLLEDVQRQQNTVPGTATKPNPFKPEKSPLDVAKFLNERTDEEISANFLATTLANLQEIDSQYLFVNNDNKQVFLNSILNSIKDVSVKTQISRNVLADVLKGNTQNTLRFLTDDLLSAQRLAETDQKAAILANPSNLMNAQNYDFEVLEYLSVLPIDETDFKTIVQPIGYVIEKEELTSNGPVRKNSIVVENPFASSTIDRQIKYGTSYRYRIRTIVYVRLRAQDTDSNEVVAIDFLLGSLYSSWKVVTTEEKVGPPAPVDFELNWDYGNERLYLNWSFPVNTQRDIKYFQVFRRRTINEPFELIKMYDFDDSLVPSPFRFETPDPQLVEKMKNPLGYFVDPEFTRRSKFIYALCAIDAHQFSSPYSVQFEVSFDVVKNKLVRRMISPEGAPKPYPNMFLLQDTFVDTIKDEGHSKIDIVFDPEYLKVYDANGNDLRLIKTGPNTRYKLQMINIDLQQEQTIEMKVEDRRSS